MRGTSLAMAQADRLRPCVVQCTLRGSKCPACPVPDGAGRAKCPQCGGPLYPEPWLYDRKGERMPWKCNNLKGCGLRVWFPVGDLDGQVARQMDSVERRRMRTAARVRRHRQRQRAVSGAEV